MKCISDEVYQVGEYSDCEYIEPIRYAEDCNVNYFPEDKAKSLNRRKKEKKGNFSEK